MTAINTQIRLNFVGDRAKAVIPSDIGVRTRVIYAIYMDGSDRPLNVGKTGSSLRGRISHYMSQVNRHIDGKAVGKKRAELIKTIAENIGKCYFKIVAVATEDESLSSLEVKMVTELNPTYNHNGGGGGGSSCLSPAFKARPLAPHHCNSPITPVKVYPLIVKEGKVKVDFTPEGKSRENVIYRIKNEVTGERYIGQTSTTFAKRMSSHTCKANASEQDFQKSELHQAIAENAEDFTVGIVRQCRPDENLDRLESEIIDHAKEIGPVLNKRRGGGGSKSSKVPKPEM